ncbi:MULTISPECIES: hydrolase [Enterococcus]|uniref:Hydrolase n=1 Tax=Candidatus Enterococcus ferrettii TaxID=2815324 RepID=A0ABV0EWJ6_9ENTE|nr:hydrolase [Enterococcus sp. 665A]MBO1342239.1 hydrolase [Enterococcus sp. 665A]
MEKQDNGTEQFIPELYSELRQSIIKMPKVIKKASGIQIYGKLIKSIIYSMDVAVIANNDADAILAVYPWTPNTRILSAISTVSQVPILAGIGGGLTSGNRSSRLGSFAEEHGAFGVVLNGPCDLDTIGIVNETVDIPIIYTVVNDKRNLQELIDNGVDIFNVAGGKETTNLVRWVREQFPEFPIIASGGQNDEQILSTIEAGANAITYTTYGKTEKYFQEKMEQYRKL